MPPRKKAAVAVEVAPPVEDLPEDPVEDLAEHPEDPDQPEDPEIIEEIVPDHAPPPVTFVLGSDMYAMRHQAGGALEGVDEDLVDEDEDGDDDDDMDDDVITAVGQLTQLMMTEEGEAISDVLHGVREALDKQNKILYRGLQLLEARFGGRGGSR
jgi:hypothetical protein